MVKKIVILFFCMFQIEVSFSSVLLSFFAFIDVRDYCMIYHAELIPSLLLDKRFVVSFLLAVFFSITSWLTLRFFSALSSKEGNTLSGNHKLAIVFFSVLIPLVIMLIMILVALFFSPVEKLILKIVLRFGYLVIFVILNLVSSRSLLKRLEGNYT